MAIMPQLTREVIHNILGGSDGMDYGHESLHDAKVVMDETGQGCPSSWWCRKHLRALRELSYFPWFMPFTNMGASTEAAEMVTFLALPSSEPQPSPR